MSTIISREVFERWLREHPMPEIRPGGAPTIYVQQMPEMVWTGRQWSCDPSDLQRRGGFLRRALERKP